MRTLVKGEHIVSVPAKSMRLFTVLIVSLAGAFGLQIGHVARPASHTRLASARPASHTRLASAPSMRVELMDDSKLSTVIDSAKPVLAYFGASWCRPCSKVKPVVEEVSEMADVLAVSCPVESQLEFREFREWLLVDQKVHVAAVPMLVLLAQGKVAGTLLGTQCQSLSEVLELCNSVTESASVTAGL